MQNVNHDAELVRKAAVDRRQLAVRRVTMRKVWPERRSGKERRAGGDRRIPDQP